jgi:AraC-like DNA-binding protein
VVLQFSSENIPVAVRRDVVEAAFGAHVQGKVDFACDVPVRVDIGLRPLGSVHLARIEATPLNFVTPANDDGLLYLSFTYAGGGVIDARGDPHRVRSGDFNVMRRNRRCTTVVDEVSTILSLALPLMLVEPRLASLDCLHGGRLACPSTARLLGDYAAALVAHADLDAATQETTAGHLIDLIVLALGATRDDAHAAGIGGVRAARLRAVKADVVAHSSEPSLDVGWIARRHGVSPATIRALFYQDGTSFTDYLRAARLEHVRTLLLSPFMGRETVANIALMAGFNDIAWFNQAFRRRFGMTPSEMRAAGHAKFE